MNKCLSRWDGGTLYGSGSLSPRQNPKGIICQNNLFQTPNYIFPSDYGNNGMIGCCHIFTHKYQLYFRRAFHIFSYYMFFFNIFLGLVSCLLRIGYGIIYGMIFIQRLQKSTLPRQFEERDPGTLHIILLQILHFSVLYLVRSKKYHNYTGALNGVKHCYI